MINKKGIIMNHVAQLLSIDKIHRLGYTGRGIVIAVPDTGCFPHKLIKQNIIHFEDFIQYKALPYDDNSHGTHVCGILCANKGTGPIYGIAPDAGIIPLKVLEHDGTTKSEKLMEGINWILNNYKKYNIRIVNISIGMPSTNCADENSVLVKAVNSLWDAGLVVVASAGNDGPDSYTITTPGISRKIITVGSNEKLTTINPYGKISTRYSSQGPTHCNIPKPDILTVGNKIISCANRPGHYSTKSGTSMSTPIVSGAAALILSYDPMLSNIRIKELLCNFSDSKELDIARLFF